MPVSAGTIAGSTIGAVIVEDTASDNTPQTVDLSGGTLYQVFIDNTANSAVSYVKLYEAVKTSVTVGTTPPSFIFPCPASVTKQFDFPTGIAYATALSVSSVTAAGTGGTTSPTGAVLVRFTIA